MAQSGNVTMPDSAKRLQDALAERFGERLPVDPSLAGLAALAGIASHRSYRRFRPQPLSPDLLRLLCACALSAPSKSDLQQGDIVIVNDRAAVRKIADAITDMPWIAAAPAFLVFVANGRRLPAISKLREKPFPNDHLDLFFNAAVDAALVLATFIHAAEAVGLGCCPISAIRDHAAMVSELLALPHKCVPVAGLCVGWPAEQRDITARLGLDATVHYDRFAEGDLARKIEAYDRRREAQRPFARQRQPERWGRAAVYGWSEDKARQYAEPLRTDFGAFVRKQGFRLD
jgi:nitroreductase/FMN reductase [NAD(P)H]